LKLERSDYEGQNGLSQQDFRRFLSYVNVGINYGNEHFCDRNINQIVPLRVSRT
jgi:hypothetical protein